jgi:AsmA protein
LDQPRPGEEPAYDIDPDLDDDAGPGPFLGFTRQRAAVFLGVLLVLVLMVVVPPLINVGRYRRQIAASISLSLGRPVHIDSVTLNMLPWPGFTLQNFVVDEDPAFGSEPVIHANEVTARLRIRSLWRRRVEFSRISLTDPSVNLVHLPNGQWNLESILIQASRMPAAPTAQKGAGDAPRFPYIEATGARVNIKRGLEKLPISITDAEFALWLPEPRQWRLRLRAHPSRTDAAATDTGTVRIEGTLGQAQRLTDVPLDLTGEWSAAPLGAVSRVLLGTDAGLRGEMTLTAQARGTLGAHQVQTSLELRNLRRADFVPARTLDANIRCSAQAFGFLRSFTDLRCAWPPRGGDGDDATAGGLYLTGTIPDVSHPASAALTARWKDVPAPALLNAVRIASNRTAPELTAGGLLSGELVCCTQSEPARTSPVDFPAASSGPAITGSLKLSGAALSLGEGPPLLNGNMAGTLAGREFQLADTPLSLGGLPGKDPVLLGLRLDASALTLHLTGSLTEKTRSRLLQWAQAVPQLGDGLARAVPDAIPADPKASYKFDAVGTRPWGGAMTWGVPPPVRTPARRKSRHSR